MMKKKKIFLTGATGHMGSEGLKQLLQRRDEFDICLLVLPTENDRKAIAPYEKLSGVEVIYGDLTRYEDVLQGVNNADYVLHVGGMVSPIADYYPQKILQVNVGAVKNIIRAIKAQSNPDRVHLVYIGTVAQTGDRNDPIHWGRVGDPIKISIYDIYALSKAMAEREVIESGLKHWVSLRQTGILYPSILNKLDPIMFHQPLNGVLEWVTAKDSGVLLSHVCNQDLPEDFWCRIYNIGGGAEYRTVNWEFMQFTFTALKIGNLKDVVEPDWFVLRNFHGQWYTDSDILESYLHFRSGKIDEFIQEMAEKAPLKMKMARFVASKLIKHLVFKPTANKPLGPLYWKKKNIEPRITAFYGSMKAWNKIAGWEHFKLYYPSSKPILLNHGYDESKQQTELDLKDMQQAAAYRGGKCLSTQMTKGDLTTKLEWQCAFGHRFKASPRLILLGGHWCPECFPMPWNYDEEAKRNPFFAQVWKPLHSSDEHNVYDETIVKGLQV